MSDYVTVFHDSEFQSIPSGESGSSAFRDITPIQTVADHSILRGTSHSPSLPTTIVPISIKKSELQYVCSALKLYFLLAVPVLGWIAFAIVQIVTKISWALYEPSEAECNLIEKIHELKSGLSSEKAKKLAYFILQNKGKSADRVHSYHRQSSVLGIAGNLPRDVIKLQDGRFVIKAYSTIFALGEVVIHRGILIDPEKPEEISYVHIKESRSGIQILDPSAPYSLAGSGKRPIDCYIINNRSDLSLLYPKELNPSDPDEEKYVDISFHVKPKTISILDRIVSIGQSVSSRGRNNNVVHVEMIRGRTTQTVIDPEDQSKRTTKHLLMIYTATGTIGTFTEVALHPKGDLADGTELHIYRFKKEDINPSALKAMHEFARHQVSEIDFPQNEVGVNLSRRDYLKYSGQYIPNLYSNFDAGLSTVSSIHYGKFAKERIASSAADELMQQRRQTETKHLGGICSAFTSLTIQVGYLLGMLSDAEKESFKRNATTKACKELTKSATALKIEIERKFNEGKDCSEIEQDLSYEDPERYPHYMKLMEILIKAAQNANPTQRQIINLYKKKLENIYYTQFRNTIKRHLFNTFKGLLQRAEKGPLHPESLEGRIAHLLQDPLFRVDSNRIMPATLHDLMTRQTATLQMIPPSTISQRLRAGEFSYL